MVHETVSVHTKKSGKIRTARVPYVEQKGHNTAGIIGDIKRIQSAVGSATGLNGIIDFLETGTMPAKIMTSNGNGITTSMKMRTGNPALTVVRSIRDGMREKDIISLFPPHYGNSHPTEKPVRLAERILALISDPGDTIYDPFMGSGSFGVACVNTGRKYIGSEMKKEYFDIARKRIKEATAQGKFNFDAK